MAVKQTEHNLEDFIEALLKKQGYLNYSIDNKKNTFMSINKRKLKKKYYCTEYYIGNTIYDSKRKCDFIIYCKEKHPKFLVIECKWQESSGSVDEKYPFLVHCIDYSKIKTVILADGGGARDGAINWMIQCSKQSRYLKSVVSMSGFMSLVNSDYF